jgi:hypothetical protein
MNVIKFPFTASRRAHARRPRWSKNGTPDERAAPTDSERGQEDDSLRQLVEAVVDRPSARSLSATGENERLRKERREAWREVDAIREYWKARLEMESAIGRAQIHGLPEGDNHPPHNPDERMALLANWRQAIAQQLLTPAPDSGAIAWKKAALARCEHEYTGIKTERLERAIADDLAFLAAHPVRQSRRDGAAQS